MKTSIRLTITTLGIVLGAISAAHAADDDRYREMTGAPSKAVEKSGKAAPGTIVDDPHYQQMTQGAAGKKEGKSGAPSKAVEKSGKAAPGTVVDDPHYKQMTK